MASLVCCMDSVIGRDSNTTISVTWAPRARMAVKASWPGVSRKTISPRSNLT